MRQAAAASENVCSSGKTFGNWSEDDGRRVQESPPALLKAAITRRVKAITRRLPRLMGQHFGPSLWARRVGGVRFGDFGRTTPISTQYGFDRGKTPDRYYIEKALANHSELVSGRVLEAAGRDY